MIGALTRRAESTSAGRRVRAGADDRLSHAVSALRRGASSSCRSGTRSTARATASRRLRDSAATSGSRGLVGRAARDQPSGARRLPGWRSRRHPVQRPVVRAGAHAARRAAGSRRRGGAPMRLLRWPRVPRRIVRAGERDRLSRPRRRTTRRRLRDAARLRATTAPSHCATHAPSCLARAWLRASGRPPVPSTRPSRSRTTSCGGRSDPLVRDATPDEILALRVLDPAMGSGAFLVARVRVPGRRLRGGADPRRGPVARATSARRNRASIRRTIAERCLFGVDLNPMAVQLARLSLWLATPRRRPAAQLPRSSSSGRRQPARRVARLARSGADTAKAPHTSCRRRSSTIEPCARRLRDAVPVRFALALEPNDTAEQVRRRSGRSLRSTGPRRCCSKWKRVADLWCAHWFAPMRRARRALSRLVGCHPARDAAPRTAVAARYLERRAAIAAAGGSSTGNWNFPKSSSTRTALACPEPALTRSSAIHRGT